MHALQFLISSFHFRAKGLQSIVQLMGEKDLYDFWSDTWKVHTLDWDREIAAQILKEWQAKFGDEVTRLVADVYKEKSNKKFDVNAFSSSQLDSILKEFSEFNWRNIGLGCLLMVGF